MSSTRNRYKAEDVQLQLGDPLPLPYKISKPTTRGDDAEEEETAVDSKHFNQPIILKKKIHDAVRMASSGHGAAEESDTSIASIPKPRPFPIRKEYLRNYSGTNRLRNLRRSSSREESIHRNTTVVDSLLEDISAVKQLSNRLSDHELYELSRIESELNSLVRQKELDIIENRSEIGLEPISDEGEYADDTRIRQNSLGHSEEPLKELERLQRLNRQAIPASHRLPFNYMIITVVVTIVGFFSLSFWMSLTTDDYCYYRC